MQENIQYFKTKTGFKTIIFRVLSQISFTLFAILLTFVGQTDGQLYIQIRMDSLIFMIITLGVVNIYSVLYDFSDNEPRTGNHKYLVIAILCLILIGAAYLWGMNHTSFAVVQIPFMITEILLLLFGAVCYLVNRM